MPLMIRRSQPGSEHGLEWGDEPEESAAADLLAISDHAHLNTRARFCGSRKERKKKKKKHAAWERGESNLRAAAQAP